MLKLLTRNTLTLTALLLLLGTSSALGARDLRSGTKHAAHRRAHHPPKEGTGGSSAVVSQTTTTGAAVLLGDEALEPNRSSLSGGQARAFPFHAHASGATAAAHLYIGPASTATTLFVGLYTSHWRHPGSLLSAGSLSTPLPGAWDTVPLAPTQLASGTTYWLAVLGTGGTLRFRDRPHGPCPALTSAQTNLQAPTTTWRTGAFYWACPVSAYVTTATTFPLEPPAPVELTPPPVETPPPPVETTPPPVETSPPPPAAPTNSALPTTAGTAEEGQVLSATTGAWSDGPTSYSYQWEDCNTAGESCSDISGATGSTYKLTASDVGNTVRVVVTATNAGGSTPASSIATAVVVAEPPPPPAAPTNSALPTISGTTTEGQVLSATTGTWTGSPTSYTYQWEDCNTAGESCANINGATSSTYKLTASDVGNTVRVAVTATNAGGSTSASSAPTAVIVAEPPPAPANNELPSVSGTAEEGKTLSATTGTWTGSPTSYAYQWQDCDMVGEGCANISGATGSTYKLTASDVGNTVRVAVTATNAGGSTSASSVATAVVVAEPPPPPAAPTNNALPTISGTTTEGQPLSATTGTWTGSPTSYAYQWENCNTAGESCANISGATSSTYKLAASDVGHTVRVAVTATNSGGSTSANSAATAVVVAEPPPPPAAPTNSALPTISGTTTEGQVLSATTGTWTGSPTSYTYQWQDCNTAGEDCANISSATSSTYKLTASDVGHTIRAAVTATNAGGSNQASSTATGTVLPLPPSNKVPPTVSGTAEEGKTLSATTGTWTGSPTSYTYQWQDCNTAGESCANISGATSSTYKLTASDVSHTVRVAVTAANAGGSTSTSSAATAVIIAEPPPAPANTAQPTVSGTAEEGKTLNTTTGTWTGSPTSYTYQWQDCNTAGESCANISGATSSTYKLTASDVGNTVRVAVTATNAGGSTSASSAATGTVLPLPPSNKVPPTVSGTDVEGETLSASGGTWTGSPTSYAYQWQDCNTAGEACSNISGATSSTYKLAASDVGHTIRVVVTASNASGSTSASSGATATVTVTNPPAGPQIFVSQAGSGGESGEQSCADARSLAWLNEGGNWGSGKGKVAPGTTVNLCGTLTEQVEVLGNGSAGKPVTISFTTGSKIAVAGNGCPGEGCIKIDGGQYITVTSAAGYKGQIENTERSYAREKGPGPGTKAIFAPGCKHCNFENLEIGPLYISEKGDAVADNEIIGIAIYNFDGEPEYDTIRNNYLHDQGWSVEVQNGAKNGHIYVEYNTFYHLTHGLYLGDSKPGSNPSIAEETFAHNRFYGDTNWEAAEDVNHVDGFHCASGESVRAHYTGLYIYDNYLTTAGAQANAPIYIEGPGAGTPCSDSTSNIWVFNNVLTGNSASARGLAETFSGEPHSYNNTLIGEPPTSKLGEEQTCVGINTEGAKYVAYKNNLISGCHESITADSFVVAKNAMEHNLWANTGSGNEVFACHLESKSEFFHLGEFSKWATCMEQPETESKYEATAKLNETGAAQSPLGEPESGSYATEHGKNLTSLCKETPEEALCKNIRGETRPSTGLWDIGAY